MGEPFWCHKTISWPDGPEPEGSRELIRSRAQLCAGAVETLNRDGWDIAVRQIAGRFGHAVAEPDSGLTFDSVEEWRDAQG